jgi:Ala-tRNA(Pro) deacylase
MPPLGNLYGLPVIADKALAADDEIVFNAGTHTESIRMKFADFERLVKPMIVEIAGPQHVQQEELEEDV